MSWKDGVDRLPALAPVEFDIDPARTGLVIIDMQYLDAHREYGLGRNLKENHPEVWSYYFNLVDDLVVPNTRRLLDDFRRRQLRVIHVTLGPVLPDGSDMVRLRRPTASANARGLKSLLHNVGTFEHGILEELKPLKEEIVINKTSRGAFNSSAFERLLLNFGLETLIFAGVTTSACVDLTARDAADRGFRCVIVEDATAELDEVSYEATLRQFVVRWGRVWTTDETLKRLGEACDAGVAG